MAGTFSASDLKAGTAAPEFLRQQIEQCCVGGIIDRRSGDMNFQFGADWRADLISGGARLKFDGKKNAAGTCANELGVF